MEDAVSPVPLESLSTKVEWEFDRPQKEKIYLYNQVLNTQKEFRVAMLFISLHNQLFSAEFSSSLINVLKQKQCLYLRWIT